MIKMFRIIDRILAGIRLATGILVVTGIFLSFYQKFTMSTVLWACA